MNLPCTRSLVIGLHLSLICAAHLNAQEASPFPPPKPPKNAEGSGAGIQRTMGLLATSTPEHRNKVRILFYGQSITEQGWWEQVVADLHCRFPNADLEVENRAIGGFASNLLIRPAEHDLYPYYPDLVIFHVYGDHRDYEQIIHNIRTRTAAEVLMQTDHVTKAPLDISDKNADSGAVWDQRMNSEILPGIAKKYGCGLVDVRSSWAAYLKENKLEPKALLKDEIHLNDHGKFVMAELIKQYLVYRPELATEEGRALAKTFEVGKDITWKEGRLALSFTGNRVNAIAAQSDSPGATARVLIDGKSPSQFPGAYAISRPTPKPWSPLALIRVDHDQPLVVENWTLTITAFTAEPLRWEFKVEGSKTGPDGSGDSNSLFVSKSGRVKIDPQSWFQKKPVEPGYVIQWSVQPLFQDSYNPPKVDDSAREYSTTLIQGLPDGHHTLELIANSAEAPAIRAIRVYHPPGAPMSFPVVPLALTVLTLTLAGVGLVFTLRTVSRPRPPAKTAA